MTDQDPRAALEAAAVDAGLDLDDFEHSTDDELHRAIEAAQAAGEQPPDGRTLDELRARASELEVPGRSTLNRDELATAIAKAEAAAAAVPEPGTPDEVGRPPLAAVAEQQLAEREERTRHYGIPNPDTEE